MNCQIASKDIINRLSRLSGQIKGIANLIEKGACCEKVLTQVLAAEGALKKIGRIVITDHMKHCVTEEFRNDGERALENLSNIIERFI